MKLNRHDYELIILGLSYLQLHLQKQYENENDKTKKDQFDLRNCHGHWLGIYALIWLSGQAIQYSYRNRCKDAGCSDWSNHYHLL